jgi:hypothetical protein
LAARPGWRFSFHSKLRAGLHAAWHLTIVGKFIDSLRFCGITSRVGTGAE